MTSEVAQARRKLPHVCFVALNAYPLLIGNREIEIVGGAQLQQVIIARKLVDRGYRVSMICHDCGQPSLTTVDGITVLRAFNPKAGLPVLRFFWPRICSVWQCMKRANADLYYQRAAAMWTGVMALFCLRYRKKSIFAAAGNPDLEANTPRIQFARDRYIYEYGLSHVDRIFVQNEEQAALCRRNYDREAEIVPNCLVPFDSVAANAGGHVLWISTIRTIKRPDIFLELARSVPQLQFRMVGGASPIEKELFEKIRLEAQNISNLEFVGFVPHAEIDRHFNGASVLVNTSSSEGFPNSFLEAWSSGIPTVAFVDSGARRNGEAVGTTVAGLQEMKIELMRLVNDDAHRLTMVLRCLEYVAQNHSVDHVVDVLEKHFLALQVAPGLAS
jgi:glycosyltransferase involved in cell wall biosynthesis